MEAVALRPDEVKRLLGQQDVQTHPLSQYNGAIGAAVLGYRKARR